MKRLKDAIDNGHVILDLDASDMASAIRETIRRVPHWTIHAFTLLQLACLSILWFVKSSGIGILFPVFIALLVPVRLLAKPGRSCSPCMTPTGNDVHQTNRLSATSATPLVND